MTRLGVGLLLVAACGDGISAPDAMTPPDLGSSIVRVRYRGELPAGNRVFFQRDDSSLVLATRTNIEGEANAYMDTSGFVTVVVPTGGAGSVTNRVFTWAGVKPGDVLELDAGGSPTSGPTTIINLSIPLDPGATTYALRSTCGVGDVRSAAGNQQLVFLDGCGGHADLLIYTAGAGFHYLYRDDVPITDQASVAFPPPYRTMERPTIMVSGVSPSSAQLRISQRVLGDGRALYNPFAEPFGWGALNLTGSAGTLNIDSPLPPGATILTQVDPFDGTVGALHWGPSEPTTRFDFGVLSLRPYDQLPAYDLATHAIRWTEQPTGAVPDAMLFTFSWTAPMQSTVWRVLAPRTEDTVIRLPNLPGGIRPTETDTVLDPPLYADFTGLAIDGGYDRLRHHFLSWRPGNALPIDSATGTVSYRTISPN